MGRCGAVGHRIAPAVDNILSPAARGEKANAPHQSTPMNRKRESLIGTPKLHGLHRPLARNKIHQEVEIAGKVAKRPGDQSASQVKLLIPLMHFAFCKEQTAQAKKMRFA